MLPTDPGLPEAQSSTASDKGKSDAVMLKDVLKPSILMIALVASVLPILFSWYLFVLKPALNESNTMDISLTKKPYSNTTVSQELKLNKGVETQLADDDLESSNEAFESEKKSESLQRNPTRRTKSTQRNTPIKSATSNIATNEKKPTAQSLDSPRLHNEEAEMRAENIKAGENGDKNKDEDTAKKIKSFAVKWKESFLTPATQPICSQVQIAMNQCPN